MMAVDLDPRDRRALIAAGVALLALGLYLGVIDPLQSRLAGVRNDVAAAKKVLDRVQEMAARAAELRADAAPGGAGRKRDDRSLLAITDDLARSAGLSSAITEMTPGDKNTVRVTMKKVGFDTMITWLIKLDHEYGVQVAKISVSATNEPGYVHSTITLRSRHNGDDNDNDASAASP